MDYLVWYKWYIFFSTLTFCVLFPWSAGVISSIQITKSYNKQTFTNKIMNNYVLESFSYVPGKIKCAILCAQNILCISYFFNPVNKLCQTHKVVFVTPSDAVSRPFTTYSVVWDETGICPTYDDYIYHRQSGACYKPYIRPTISDYNNNVNFCSSKGEELFHHYDAVRLDQLAMQLNASSAYFTHPQGFFIAGSDDRIDGLWEYADGSPVTDFVWYGDQPQNRDTEDFMAIKFDDKLTFKFGMSDAKPTWGKSAICQKF